MVRKENISVWGSHCRSTADGVLGQGHPEAAGRPRWMPCGPRDGAEPPGSAPEALSAWVAAEMLTCGIFVWTRGGVEQGTQVARRKQVKGKHTKEGCSRAEAGVGRPPAGPAPRCHSRPRPARGPH